MEYRRVVSKTVGCRGIGSRLGMRECERAG